MRTFWDKTKPILKEIAFYLALFLFSVVCYVIFVPKYLGTVNIGRGEYAKALALFLVIALIVVFGFLVYKRKVDSKVIIFFMILIAFAVRLGYILYTEGTSRQYDTFPLDSNAGHYHYATYIYENGKLPDNNSYQFYHPPLNAFVQAVFMHIFYWLFTFINEHMLFVTGGTGLDVSTTALFSACQTLSLIQTVVITVYASKIFRELNLNRGFSLLGLAFVIFFPRFNQLSGQLNNDLPAITFAIVSVYYAIRFYNDQTIYNTVMLALSVGLAIMAKLNGAMICVPIAVLMLIILFKEIFKGESKKSFALIGKYALFVVICAPLALWFQIYAGVRFDQSFGYVFPYLNGQLSVAEHTFFERFFLPSFSTIFNSPFANAWDDYNLFDYTVKSSMFGEFGMWNGTAFAVLAVILHYVLIILFVTLLVFWFIHKKKAGEKVFDLRTILFFSMIACYSLLQFYFNLKMPYGCTMDFRYIVPIVLSAGGMLSIMITDSKKTAVKGYESVAFFTGVTTVIFLVVVTVFYLVCI